MGIGFVVLFLWPVVVFVLFRKLPLQAAIVWSIIGGFLLLPSENRVVLDVPLLPDFDKNLIPALATATMASLAVARLQKQAARLRTTDGARSPGLRDIQALQGWLPRTAIGLGMIVLILFGDAMTAMTNLDPLQFGPRTLWPLRPYDAGSYMLAAMVTLLPMLIGRKYLADVSGHRTLLIVFCIAGVIYCLPALYEVRMSPQINRMVYGFFPHSWVQHIRGNGFRPLVFLNHGLVLGIFLACSTIATGILLRSEQNSLRRFYFALALIWLLGSLVLAKTLGALVITLVLLPVVLFCSIRQQLIVAGMVAVLTLAYPILRGTDIVPTEALVGQFEKIDVQRANSLAFRFGHEDALLDRANERPIFGWGGNARSRIFNDRGEDISVTDGVWVIIIGQGGWVGYIGTFGLLTIPLILIMLRPKRYQIDRVTAGLCVLIAGNLLDLLPNSGMTPALWLAAGAILGRLEAPRVAKEPDLSPPMQDTVRGAMSTSPYTRFPQTKRREA